LNIPLLPLSTPPPPHNPFTPPRTGAGIASARTFDLRVISKTESTDHIFSSIPKEEEDSIKAYLKAKNVRVKDDLEEMAMAMEVDEEDEMDEMDDDDVESDDGGSIVSVDRGKGKGKSTGKSKGKDGGKEVRKGGGNEDDESGES
jgi:structure-specific recognition protein 1